MAFRGDNTEFPKHEMIFRGSDSHKMKPILHQKRCSRTAIEHGFRGPSSHGEERLFLSVLLGFIRLIRTYLYQIILNMHYYCSV